MKTTELDQIFDAGHHAFGAGEPQAAVPCPIRVSPVRFYEDDRTAMADMERCAAEEEAAKEKGLAR